MNPNIAPPPPHARAFCDSGTAPSYRVPPDFPHLLQRLHCPPRTPPATI